MRRLKNRLSYVLFVLLVILFIGNNMAYSESLLPEGLVIEDRFEPGIGEPIGEVELVQGKVVLIHSSDKQIGYMAQKGLPLFKGDIIITQEKGRIRLALNDGSAMSLASDTRLEINESIYDPEKKTRSSFMSMALGKARFWVTKLTGFKRSDFKVKTKTAVVGVRGSDFIVVATETRTEVTALEKTDLEIVSLVAPEVAPMVLTDFEQTNVEAGGLPSEAIEIILEDIEIMKQEFTIMPEMTMPDEKPERPALEPEEMPEKPEEHPASEILEKSPELIMTPEKISEGVDFRQPPEYGIRVPENELVKPEEIGRMEVPKAEEMPDIQKKSKQSEEEDVSPLSPLPESPEDFYLPEMPQDIPGEPEEPIKKEENGLPDFPNSPEDFYKL